MKKIKNPPPPLNLTYTDDDAIPPEEMPPGSKPYKLEPLDVDYIIGRDWKSLLTNALWAIVIFLISFLFLVKKVHFSYTWASAVSLCIISTLAALAFERLYTTVESRQGKFFLDLLTGEMKVYGLGFKFTTWHSRHEVEEIEFQKHEVIVASKKDGTEVIFPTQDGKIEMFSEFKLWFQRVETRDALGNSLNYEIEEIQDMVLARLARRLSDVGGKHSYESLLYYKADLVKHAGSIFATRKNRSQWEVELGINVTDINFTRIDLTDESRKFVNMRAVGEMVESITKEHSDELDVHPETAYQGALAITGAVPQTRTTNVVKVEGIPAGTQVVSIGGTGTNLAVSPSQK